MHKRELLSFEVDSQDLASFRHSCAAQRKAPTDVLRDLLYQWLTREGVVPVGRQKLKSSDRLVLEAFGEGPCTIRDIESSSGLSRISVRASVKALVERGFLVPVAPVKTATSFASAFNLSDVGRLWKLEQMEPSTVRGAGPTPLELRAAVKVFLVSNGLSLQAATKALEDEELIAHMGDYKMDYSIEFWKERLAAIREES